MQENQSLKGKSMAYNWTSEVDVVVIGSGFAGLTAALEAGKAGVSVLVLEKRKSYGGNSIMSSGVLAASDSLNSLTIENKEIQNSPELMYQDMLKAGRGLNDPALVKVVAENSNQILQWTINELGTVYKDRVDQLGGHSVARCYTPHNASGSAIVKPLLTQVKALGIDIETGIMLTTLVTDASYNIQGVEVQQTIPLKERDKTKNNQTLRRIKARKAVILATGGFSGDVPFRTLQDPQLTEDINDTNRPDSTAEALIEAMKIGAKVVDLSCIQLAPWGCPDEKSLGFGGLIASCAAAPYGILINPTTGKRFVNESADRKTRTDAILKIGQPCLGIVDSEGLKNADYIMRNSDYNIEQYIQRDVIKRWHTLDDLASHYHIPRETLNETVKNFNHAVTIQHDAAFNKTILPNAQALRPPYYVVRIWPKVHYTMGGLKINTKAQVVNQNDDPILRLYAAGEVTGGIHGASRLSDCATTECLVFGQIAGRNAATEVSST